MVMKQSQEVMKKQGTTLTVPVDTSNAAGPNTPGGVMVGLMALLHVLGRGATKKSVDGDEVREALQTAIEHIKQPESSAAHK